MDEKHVYQRFRRQKIITIDQLVKLLTSSVITARRRLKKWQTYTSINKNGRYYTLPQIPVFDENGLWWYQTVLFSGSSGKSVGKFRFGKFSHREKQCDFKDFIASKAERFSRNEIYFAIQALNNT